MKKTLEGPEWDKRREEMETSITKTLTERAKMQGWINPKGKLTVLIKDYKGKLLNGPNDIWIRPDGGAYFTDPYYKRDYWKRGPKEQDKEAVYYLAPDHKTLTRVADDLQQPNGIIGTPDGQVLYVADIGGNKTYSYDIQPDGALKNKQLFCKLGSDGMTIDNVFTEQS